MRILCFGDSNTFGYDPRSYFGDRYPAQHRWVDLVAEKSGWEMVNIGQNGREIPHRTYEMAHVYRELSDYAPADIVVVLLGYNDLLQGASVPEILSRMEKFLTQLPSDCGDILLVAPPPMKLGRWVPEEHLLTASSQLAEDYQTLAHKLGIGFADAAEWNVELTYDGVHFSEAGHAAFAEGIYSVLKYL